jgi:pyrimidine operon attenuation protein / uracil phosphoribosyltransferase
MKSLILDKEAIKQKITRLAYEIVEDHFDENEIQLVGIMKGGYKLAELLKTEIQKVKKIRVQLSSIKINKTNPLVGKTLLSEPISSFEGQPIILVDDVVNSGRTIFYAFKEFMDITPKTLKVAALVDRKYKKFPVNCDYVGTSLNTTIKEHIEVVFKKDDVEAVYLI